jgi:hypothetical protein
MKIKRPKDYVPDRSFLKFISLIPHAVDARLDKAEYLCECGEKCIGYVSNVKTGKKISCGCKKGLGTPKHGLSEHPLYAAWENMYSRCYNAKVISYKNYGGRGVEMCNEWKDSPEVFIRWGLENGWQIGLELDKDIKGNGMLYSPETCLFVTRKVNGNNRRVNRKIAYNGETKTLAEWADGLGISHSTFHHRLKKWSIERAITEPLYYSKPNRKR